MKIPSNFRRLSPSDRRAALYQELEMDSLERDIYNGLDQFSELSDILIENSIGFTPIPLGLVPAFPVNGKTYAVPLATEEPSVVAALNFSGKILSRCGGITAVGAPSLTKGQVFLEGTLPDATQKITDSIPHLEEILMEPLQKMTARGGGLRGWEIRYHPGPEVLEAGFWVDCVDALGANLVNTLAEKISSPLEKISGGKKLMAILSNSGEKRLAHAEFNMPASLLGIVSGDPDEQARRIVKAGILATDIPQRAVTHNKGIMNGITALALATGNDTRALEASVHAYAARDGQYRGLTAYTLEEGVLRGTISLPLPLATSGGATGIHPACTAALKILGTDSAAELSAVTAAVGLAQNLAALIALTGQGIQLGHMKYHASRLAWSAGARGSEIKQVVGEMTRQGRFDPGTARTILAGLRQGKDHA